MAKLNIRFTILLIFITFSSHAQLIDTNWHPLYTNYTTIHGLPSAETYDVKKDSKGYMWVSTDHGVARFNGESFTTFTTRDGLGSNTIFHAIEDEQDRIWFFSNIPDLYYLENDVIKPYKYNHVLRKIQKTFVRYALKRIQGDRLILSTMETGTFQIDANGNVQYLQPIETDENAAMLFSNHNGFPVHSRHTYKRLKNKRHPIQFIMHSDTMRTTFVTENNLFIEAYSNSLHVIASENELRIFDLSQKEIQTIVFDKIITYAQVIQGELWIGLLQGGVMRFRRSNRKFKSDLHLFKDYSITNIAKTSHNELWLSTLSNGLFYLPNTQVSTPTNSKLANGNFYSIAQNEGSLYLPESVYGNVNILELETMVLSSMPKISSISSFSLVQIPFDPAIAITIENENQRDFPTTYLLKNGKRNKTDLVRAPFDLRYTSENNLIAGNSMGLSILNDTVTIIPIDGGIRTLETIDDKNIWYSNYKGTYQFNLETKKSTIPRNEKFADRSTDILKAPDGTFYFTTHGNGLWVKKGSSLRQYTSSEGLMRDFIVKILYADDDTFWLLSHEGISHVSLNGFDLKIINDYNVQFLGCQKINDALLDGNNLYLTTNRGLIRIDASTSLDPKLPLLHIDNLSINDNIRRSDNLELNYLQNTIAINYDAISYSKSPVQFRYRLNPDDKWLFTQDRVIHLSDLNPGHYYFELQASNNSKTWTKSKKINFSIAPPYWETWWFRLLAASSILLLLYLATRWQIRRLKKRNALSRRMIELQQIALTQQMNPHFVYNAMGSLQNSILKGEVEKANNYIVDFSRLLRKGLDASRAELITLEEEINLIRNYLKVEQVRLRDQLEYEIINENIETPELLYVSPFLEQPFIENSIKHGIAPNDSGKITVKYRLNEDVITCTIEDDGIGFDEDKIKSTSYGSSIAFERIELLNNLHGKKMKKEIINKNQEGNSKSGIVVTFTIPVIRQ